MNQCLISVGIERLCCLEIKKKSVVNGGDACFPSEQRRLHRVDSDYKQAWNSCFYKLKSKTLAIHINQNLDNPHE